MAVFLYYINEFFLHNFLTCKHLRKNGQHYPYSVEGIVFAKWPNLMTSMRNLKRFVQKDVDNWLRKPMYLPSPSNQHGKANKSVKCEKCLTNPSLIICKILLKRLINLICVLIKTKQECQISQSPGLRLCTFGRIAYRYHLALLLLSCADCSRIRSGTLQPLSHGTERAFGQASSVQDNFTLLCHLFFNKRNFKKLN